MKADAVHVDALVEPIDLLPAHSPKHEFFPRQSRRSQPPHGHAGLLQNLVGDRAAGAHPTPRAAAAPQVQRYVVQPGLHQDLVDLVLVLAGQLHVLHVPRQPRLVLLQPRPRT